jgi:hypothetical protein
VLGEILNERDKVITRPLRYIGNIPAQGLEHAINRMLPVKELPDVDAGGVQTETMTAIRVEENSPVVKLFPVYDVRIGYGFFTVFHLTSCP